MRCETCNDGKAEVIVNRRNSKNVCLGAVCDCCASLIWGRISSGTSARDTFTVRPYNSHDYRSLRKEVDILNTTLSTGVHK